MESVGNSQAPAADSPSPPAECASRRSFLAKTATTAVATASLATPMAGGVMVLLNPLQQAGGDDLLLRVGSLESLPANGAPVKTAVVAERVDAWTRSIQAVGTVYLRRVAKREVQALQAVCPHAGCTVEYKSEHDGYICPCHKAAFDIEGRRRSEQSPSPRDMDSLEVEVRNQNEIWLRFRTFQTGTADKITTV